MSGMIEPRINHFVPEDFDVPEGLETDRYRLKPLVLRDVVKDYDAVATSFERCRDLAGPGFTEEGMTFEQDLVACGWMEKEFHRRSMFTYAAESLDGEQFVGCLYIMPPDKGHFFATPKTCFDAVVMFWVRESEADTGLDEHLFATARKWLAEAWPFDNVVFPGPGRDMSWEEWEALPD